MTTTWCWPPIVRVLPRHGINAFVKKDNKVLTFLQTCEYLLWILVSLFAQRHTKTIPVEFQTSERRLACSHPRLEFQSGEKAKKKTQHSNSNQQSRYPSNHVITLLLLGNKRARGLRFFLIRFPTEKRMRPAYIISTIFPWKPKRAPLLPLVILRKVKRV